MKQIDGDFGTVNTFIYIKTKARDDMPDIGGGDDGVVFKDNFDLYGASCIPAGWISKSDGETRYEGNYISNNGSSVRITNATDLSFDFDVAEAADYILRWGIPKTSGGYSEALVGNIRLVNNTASVNALTAKSSVARNGKFIRNNRLYIQRDCKLYTAPGIQVNR